MNIIIESPTKAIIDNYESKDIQILDKTLTYINTSISFQIKNHSKNVWWKHRDPITYQEKMEELQSKLENCLLNHDGENYWIRPGSIPYIDIPYEIVSKIHYPDFKPITWKSKPEFEPFGYQKQAVEALMNIKHGNISLPTGAGKSLILLLLTKHMGLDTVVVTPSQSIFNELFTEFEKRLGKNMVGGYGDGKKDITKKITIAIGKSLTMLKPGTNAYEFFKNKQVMIVDESHGFASEQLNEVCHGVLSEVPYRMFASATQTRNDGSKKLLESIIGQNVLEMDLEQAINGGYLCPLKFAILSTTSPDTRYIDDPIKCKRAHFLYNLNLASLISNIANSSWEQKQESTLILVEELRQIEMLKKLMKVPFGYVHSASKKNASEFGLEAVDLQEQVDKFNNGEIKVLIGTKAIATGTNLYPVHNCINWMGGSSEIVTKQGPVGRSTRKLEISKYNHLHKPKICAMIYDFRIKGVPILEKQLMKRVDFYKESGGEIRYF